MQDPDPKWQLRQVGYGDVDAGRLIEEVQAEYVARYGGRDDSPVAAEDFTEPHGAFFVGYLDGEPVVSGAWRRRSIPGEQRPVAELKRMYVVPGHRGRGLARRMLSHLEEQAAASGLQVLVLETGIRQPEAIELYLSSGYHPIAGFGHYRDSDLSRCFAKELSGPGGTPRG